MLKFGKTLSNPMFLALGLSISATAVLANETYVTDQGHSEVRFGWNRAGISVQTAEFTEFEGVLTLDPVNIEGSSLDVVMKVASLNSGFHALDKELLSGNFLAVESYPVITFKSTKIERTGDNTADVTGDMTIHGVTNSVTLQTKLTHRGPHPYAPYQSHYSGNWVAFSASTTIDHQAFKVGGYSAGPISVTIVTEMQERE